MTIDLNFRPASYMDFGDPVALALNGITGQMRREMVRDMLTAEGKQREEYDARLGPIDPSILEERADASFISTMNHVGGPSWMGGEYLPKHRRHEVEIARIVLQSVTMDVFSIRARWSGGRYRYRIVDEYEGVYTLTPMSSARTLTLGRVIRLIETVKTSEDSFGTEGGLVECWWNQQREHGDDPEGCVAFAWVESELYPDLARWYEQRAREWVAAVPVDVEEEEEDSPLPN